LVENIDKAFDLLTPTPLALEIVDKPAAPKLFPKKPIPLPSLVPRQVTLGYKKYTVKPGD
jgi:hypothetical protein